MVVLGLLINILPEKSDQIKKTLGVNSKLGISSITADTDRMIVDVSSESLENGPAISRELAMIDGVKEINLAYYRFIN
ncbi:MAG: hypothetical protein HY808_04555 [Nitrospirae bacterium]|nr:hypothetical protein [Nitrospirota bacterium]